MSGITLIGQTGANWPGNAGHPTQPLTYTSTAGNTLILSFAFDNGIATAASGLSVADSAGNTWQYSTANANNPPYAEVVAGGSYGMGVFIAWCIGAAAVTSVTITIASNYGQYQGSLSEWSGIVTASTAAAAESASSASNIVSPPVTAGNAGDLVVGSATSDGGLGSTTGTQFTYNQPNSCYSLPGATGPFTFTWDNTNTGNAVAVAVFSPVAPSSGTSYLTGSAVPALVSSAM